MATGIDVFLTGLMLICIQDQPNCPQGSYTDKYPDRYQNTAWAVKANEENGPEKKVCGWYRGERTRFEVKFKKDDFDEPVLGGNVTCLDGKNGYKLCGLGSYRDVCLIPDPPSDKKVSSLDNLPRLDEIDRRLVAPREALRDYISNTIHFPTGTITSGPIWPTNQDGTPGKATRWYRSDGIGDAALPRQLSDRLKVAYSKAASITVTNCVGITLIKLTPKLDNAAVLVQNVATYPPVPDYKTEDGIGYDHLTYLAWYYLLGEWDTENGDCPEYERTKKNPVLLGCVSKKGVSCSFNPSADTDSRFWPPMLGPAQ